MSAGLAIVSGGMDSVTMLYNFHEQIGAVLSFDYGSKHNHKEIPFAVFHAQTLRIQHLTISLDFINNHFSSHLLSSGGAVPNGHYKDTVMKQTVVPFRNGIMLSIAAGIAESQGLSSLYIANHAGDHTIYPDCRPAFIQPMAEAIRQGTYANIQLFSPYQDITKREIALRGKALGIDYTQTWSCYKGKNVHCGTCGTCVERQEALTGFDSTHYLQEKTP